MTYESLEEKMSRLVDFEKNNAVTQWQCSSIDYWPVLKNIIYFEYRRTNRNVLRSLLHSPGVLVGKVVNRLMNNNRAVLTPKTVCDFRKTDLLCSGANTHRAVYNDVSYNKYFDPLMDQVAPQISSFLCDYSPLPDGLYKPERVMAVGLNSKSTASAFSMDEDLRKNIRLISREMNISESYLLNSIEKTCKRILQWKQRWQEVLNHTAPSAVLVLCYYNEPMYGLLLACKAAEIPSVDMQHGGQGILHPAYTFHSENINNFNTLPDYFWVWDAASKDHLTTWLQKSQKKAIIGGNPWIEFLRTNSKSAATKNIICTLTIGLPQIIPEYLLSAILSSSLEYKWYLRMHPRTSNTDKKQLARLIKKFKLKEKVNIIEANSEPLPVLLNSAWAHISHSSGSIAEAALMGVKRNIITSEIGKVNHENLINEMKAAFFDPQVESDLFAFLLKAELAVAKDGTSNYNYKSIVEDVIKKDKSLLK